MKRGPNFERNNAARIRRRAQKQARKECRGVLSADWRADRERGCSQPPVQAGSGVGFFSGCDSEVQRELRDSRAQLYIAQNKLKAQKAKKDLEAMNSVQGIVQQMIDVSTAVAKLQKQSTDQAVQGWAKTVAASMSKSITESSSSVPSLESVGFGASGLRSTDGEVLDPMRVAAYERDLKYVEDSFADMEGYSEEDYVYAVGKVKQEFADVAFTKSQRDVFAAKALAVQRLLSLGVDYQKVQEAIYPDDE
jgi:hypothetical protein